MQKIAKMRIISLYSSAMRILIPFSHHICILHFLHYCIFAVFLPTFRIFLALFTTSWRINREKVTKKVEEVRKCKKYAKSAMQMQNANAMQNSVMRCDELIPQEVRMPMRCKKALALPSLLPPHASASFIGIQQKP
jgi:hypothetical protein